MFGMMAYQDYYLILNQIIQQGDIDGFITYDENYKYVNTIQYPLDKGVYSKAQLRILIIDVKLSSTDNLYAGDVWIIQLKLSIIITTRRTGGLL